MDDPIIHPHADLITGKKRKRSIWMKNSIRTIDRYTQKRLDEMAAWEDPEPQTTQSMALIYTVIACLFFILGFVCFSLWSK